MSNPVIQVENLSKRYKLGQFTARTLREEVEHFLRRFRKSTLPYRAAPEFWALKDLSFSVQQGEVVGIIGRNGAGKSTLLKILSRITEPTSGLARTRGRVASLLEVGTGFHPDLTGRDNIYLNGTILGMTKAEVKAKFDDIVSFSEIDKLLDTPVKRYSSGMYVRLAFAVAAYLEPEILIVDEVLAVGDASFQKKCLGKMESVAKQGRTILFVSHNLTAIRALCTTALLLQRGILIQAGDISTVVRTYLTDVAAAEQPDLETTQHRSGDGTAKIVSLRIENADGANAISSTSRLKVTIKYAGSTALRHATFLIGVYDYTNTGLFVLDSNAYGDLADLLPREGTIICTTGPIRLTPGRCYVNVALRKGPSTADYIQHAATFDVEADDAYGAKNIPARDWAVGIIPQEWLA